MKTVQEMSCRVMQELIAAYQHNYFEGKTAQEMSDEIDCSRYEAILDWAELTSPEEYDRLINEDANNDYDKAFDIAQEAFIKLIFG